MVLGREKKKKIVGYTIDAEAENVSLMLLIIMKCNKVI